MRMISNCNVCVVGGAGFLGSHLVNHLVEDRACKVLVIDNLVAGCRHYVHPAARFEHADITDSEDYLRGLFHKYKTQYVLNYSAWPYIVDSFSRPLHVFKVNATGAMQVINAAQEAGVEAILQVSSAELYGRGRVVDDTVLPGCIDEENLVEPHSTYGAAKAAVDYYCQCAWRERQTSVIALRQFNCLGERETHSYVVPEIISQIERHRSHYATASLEGDNVDSPIVRLGNDSFRDFLYAGDAVRLAVDLLEKGTFGEVYNLGSEEGIKIYDLAKMVGKLMGFEDVQVEEDAARKRPWEIWHLLSSNEKIYSVIGRPELVPLKEALQRTIAWYEANGRRWPWER